jgi:5-methylcytosine-specific restriction endonuclease McrA
VSSGQHEPFEGDAAPTNVRSYVLERDGNCCRHCGQFVEVPHLHHIDYRSQGGKNTPANLITLAPRCHLYVVHANKTLWQPVLHRLTELPGVTGLQLIRWARRAG